MGFDTGKLDAIYGRADGQCHICRKRLARKNYGKLGARGAWEVEHSKPRSKGGSDHGNNLYAACIFCNRSKGNATTRSARLKNGNKAAPYSAKRKRKNAVLGAGSAASLAYLLVPPQLKIIAVVASAVVGGIAGHKREPE